MKIVVSAAGKDLDAEVDPRFGRCQYLAFVDTDTMEFEAIENAAMAAGGGAGIATAQTVADRGAKAVLTGNMGPNAYEVLSQAGIQVLTGVSGKVKDVVEAFKSGSLSESSGPTVGAHHGTGAGSLGSRSGGGETNAGELSAQVQGIRGQLDDVLQRLDALERGK